MILKKTKTITEHGQDITLESENPISHEPGSVLFKTKTEYGFAITVDAIWKPSTGIKQHQTVVGSKQPLYRFLKELGTSIPDSVNTVDVTWTPTVDENRPHVL